MPRVNPLRNLTNERNVAERVRYERERAGMSYAGLAERMRQAGFPIQPSAVFNIEKGDPPRRVAVDELVGFATVFEVDVAEMLTPVSLVHDRDAATTVREAWTIYATLNKSIDDLTDLLRKVRRLAPESRGRVDALMADGEDQPIPSWVTTTPAGERLNEAYAALLHAVADLSNEGDEV
ncbi:helix-turn-helix domain-containing protein [Jatrophihabitans sp. YIM 134969]